MLDTYCAHCGAVSQIGDQFCAGCGTNLAAQPTYAAAPKSASWTTDEPTDWTAGQPREWQPDPNPLKPLDGIGPFGVRRVLGSTFRLFGSSLWLIIQIVFLVMTPFEIFKAMTLAAMPEDWPRTLITLLLAGVCNVLIAPALVYALMKILETDSTPGVNESFRWGLTKLGRLAVCAGISWSLQALGYMLCIIPGIIVSLSLALVYPVAILEKGSPADVLRRSSELTQGYRWDILGAGIVLGLLIFAVRGLAQALLGDVSSLPLAVFAGIVQDTAEQAGTVLSLVMYLTLVRTPRQGNSLQGNSILSLTN